jgi:hypothetical protein
LHIFLWLWLVESLSLGIKFNTLLNYKTRIILADSWGSQDILAGFEPADPRSNRGESVLIP